MSYETDKQAGTWVSGYLQTLEDKSMLTSVGLQQTRDGFQFETMIKHDTSETEDEWIIVDPGTLEFECVIDNITTSMTHRTVYVGNELTRSRLTLKSPPSECAARFTDATTPVHITIRVKNGKTFVSGSFTPPARHYPLGHPQGPKGYMVWVKGKELIFVRSDGSQLTYQADLTG